MNAIRWSTLCWIAPLMLLLAAAAPALAGEVDDYVRDQMERMRIPGLALAVVRNGEVVKTAGYGLANVEHEVPARPDTIFQIQSITKIFTATGVMLLAEQGKVRLDQPITGYLDGLPEAWKPVTVRHLLSHTSGIKDFINDGLVNLRLEVTPEEVVRSTAGQPLNFAPGERYSYSNSNYHLLGMLIQKLSGKTWGDYLWDRVFRPLGMSRTRVVDLYDVLPHRASGYVWRDGGLRNGFFVAPSILGYAGGGLTSTVLDLARWDAALSAGKVLKPASLEQMWSATRLNDGSAASYGLGWTTGSLNGRRTAGHGGSHMTGFTSDYLRCLEDGLSVIVFTNQRGAQPSRIGAGVARRFDPDLRPRAIEDGDPARTAALRQLLLDARQGKLDPELFTPELRGLIFPDGAREIREELARRGRFKRLELLERSDDAPGRLDRMRAVFEKGSLYLRTVRNAEGKISGVQVLPE